MDKKVLIEGIAIGALAGAIGGLLLAPKSGPELRGDIKAHLNEIKDKIVAKLEGAGDFTKEKYEQVVKAVVGEYEAAKKITVDEAEEIKARLHSGYESIKATICEHAAPGEAAPTA